MERLVEAVLLLAGRGRVRGCRGCGGCGRQRGVASFVVVGEDCQGLGEVVGGIAGCSVVDCVVIG